MTKSSRALLSVSDKTGLLDLARALTAQGIDIISTGGTAKALREAGVSVADVSEVTGFPEMMDGRVKTLHPKIHGGLLALRDNKDHQQSLKTHDIGTIDYLIVNLYPFEETLKKGEDFATCMENIDIGGPAMIRAAAKNFASVTVIVDPNDYESLIEDIKAGGSLSFRQAMAQKAYARTASYDAAIANWLAEQSNIKTPTYRAFGGTLSQPLRYGENPHQNAALYRTSEQRSGVVSATQHQGKELSYNNINDTDAAFECVTDFDPKTPTVVIVKHANPCGVATASTLKEAYLNALECDSTSAFGGIIALNQTLDEATAQEIAKLFTEVIIAPEATPEAKAILAAKKNLRLLTTGALPDPRQMRLMVKTVAGGLLVQSGDNALAEDLDLKPVTTRQPTAQEMQDLVFAFKVAKHVKSNTIIYAKNGATKGIGAGQMSRVDAAHIGASKAGDKARNCVAASDAFFPFADGLLEVIKAGATAVIQPGGSMRDSEVINAANQAGIAMVFTGMRHFRH